MAGRSTASGAGRTGTGARRSTVERPVVARAPAPRRRPTSSTRARRRTPPPPKRDLIDRGIDGVGRGIASAGKSVGRAVIRTRELDPAHRRDGLGVALLVLAVISAAGIWFGTGGPVGRALTTGIGYVVG